MASLNGFNAENVPPQSFEALPAGWYECAIVASESKTTKDRRGTYLQLTLEVLDGEYKGRKVFDRLNLDNPNAQAVEIARGTLSAICHAVGVMAPQDSSELHDKPLRVKVTCREYQGDVQNEVKGYKALKDKPTGPPHNGNGSRKNGVGNGNGNGGGRARWKPARVAREQEPATSRASLPDYGLDGEEGEEGDE